MTNGWLRLPAASTAQILTTYVPCGRPARSKRTAPLQLLRVVSTVPPKSSWHLPVVPGGNVNPQNGDVTLDGDKLPYSSVGAGGGVVSSTYVVTAAALVLPAWSTAVTRRV